MSINLKKILYPTDFSELSTSALPYAVELAEQFGAEVHCLHVIDELAHSWMGAGETGVPLVVSPQDIWRQAEQQMQEFTEKYLKDLPVTVKTKLIEGRPFVEIIRYGRSETIDLIVIATHGRGGLASVLLGSVTEKVVRKSPCPVLTVRHPEHEFVMP